MPKRKRSRKTRKKRSGKKMPANVLKYFKLIGQGKSKAEARRLAGLPPKSKRKRKKWGPGHPLWEWQHKHKRKHKKR